MKMGMTISQLVDFLHSIERPDADETAAFTRLVLYADGSGHIEEKDPDDEEYHETMAWGNLYDLSDQIIEKLLSATRNKSR